MMDQREAGQYNGSDAGKEQQETSFGSYGDGGRVRRGAIWGGMLGFVLGLIPLFGSTIVFAIAGAVLARSAIRLEGGSAPRLRFRSKTA
jgi:hypothetical protein